MPEAPFPPKPREHPIRRTDGRSVCARHIRHAELQVTTNFTFLTGASHPEELVEQAAALGLDAIAVTDRNSLAGIVRAHVAGRDAGVRVLVGCRLDLEDAPSLLIYPTGRRAYAALCRLLTVGRRRAPKGQCALRFDDVVAAVSVGESASPASPASPTEPAGPADVAAPTEPADLAPVDDDHLVLAAIATPDPDDPRLVVLLHRLRSIVPAGRRFLAASCLHDGADDQRLDRLATLAADHDTPLLATNDVHYHVRPRKALQDVLTCIRHGCTLADAGRRLWPHAERHLAGPGAMRELFAAHPDALDQARRLAERCSAFDLDQLRYQYPEPDVAEGRTAIEHLRDLAFAGAAEHYPDGLPDRVRDRLDHELAIIADLRYEPYFLTVHDIVRFARSRGILCQGRGAAANSAVCYCLGLTAVDPDRVELLFERFVSRERNEPPDIDIDFEHERREEVIQYIYARYGRERAALTATVISYRARSAIREVGRTLGLSLDCVDRMAKNLDRWSDRAPNEERIRELGLDPDDPTIRATLDLTAELVGFPRHLSQHVGGFVITHGPLCELVPVENAAMEDRTVIEWDKDDIDAMGMLKIDVLGLGMLTCVRKAFALIDRHEARSLGMGTVPPEDPAVYDMICRADTIGVFQIESRAQMTMLPRLKPRCWYDLVIEVAIVRPGPIQGDMVHPYLRRRQGLEPVTYPSEAVRSVLERTLGVPLFQEQAMSLAMVAAGFTAGEADQLRRAMAAWKRKGDQMVRFGEQLVSGMLERGYERDFAERVFAQLRGFSEYGFPESHAASFALIVYVSCWLKHHYPAVFCCAIVNSQPMGFYAPAQLVRDARDHGVPIRPVDVNFSGWDCRLESVPVHAVTGRPDARRAPVRLGMRLVKGLSELHAQMVDRAVRERGPFHSVEALWRASGVPLAALRALGRADAFRSMGLDRQAVQWRLSGLSDAALPLFDAPEPPIEMTPEIAAPPAPVHEPGAADVAAAGAVVDGRRAVPPVPEAWDAVAEAQVAEAGSETEAEAEAGEGEGEARGVDVVSPEPSASAEPPESVEAPESDEPFESPEPSDSPESSESSGAPTPPGSSSSDGPTDDASAATPWLPPVNELTRVVQDYQSMSLSLRDHPVAFLRPELDRANVVTAAALQDGDRSPHGRRLAVAGIALVRQRPSTASGVVFITLEDETGVANLIIRPTIYERDRRAARHGVVLLATGSVERAGRVVHVMVRRLETLDHRLQALRSQSRDFH